MHMRKIRYDEESEKFYKLFWKLNKVPMGSAEVESRTTTADRSRTHGYLLVKTVDEWVQCALRQSFMQGAGALF